MAKAKKPAKKVAKNVTKKSAKPAKKSAKKASASKKAAPKKAANKVAIKKTLPKMKAAPQQGSTQTTSKSKWNLLPLSDRLVVRVEGPSEKTAGGLYIPATAEERPTRGEVLAIGPGSKSKKGHLKPLDVRKGEFVLFNSYAGIKTSIDGQDVLILREEDVLGVVSK